MDVAFEYCREIFSTNLSHLPTENEISDAGDISSEEYSNLIGK